MVKTQESRAGQALTGVKAMAPLLAILAVALAMRLLGITWGLPSPTHFWSYHPDESRVMIVILGLDWLHGQILPHFYNYGSLQIYLVSLLQTVAYVTGNADLVQSHLQHSPEKFAQLFLIGRALTALMGAGTVWTTYAIGRRLWNPQTGLTAAALLAVVPLHAQHSHWMTVDVPATFWASLSFLWSVRLAGDELKPLKAAILAGLFAGLATATKYNLALMALPLLAAAALPLKTAPSKAFLHAVVGIAVMAAAFLLACPGAILEHGQFLADLRTEMLHVGKQGGETFAGTGNGFLFQIKTNLLYGLGPAIFCGAIAAVIRAVVRRDRGDLLMASFVVPYFILISLPEVRYARYVMPLLPFLVLWLGHGFMESCTAANALLRRIALAVGAVAGVLAVVSCSLIVAPMAGTDSRDRALQEIEASHLSGPTAFATMPWFQTVPLDQQFSNPMRGAWRRTAGETPQIASPFLYADKDWDMGVLDSHPNMVVLSEYDYRDPLRLNKPAARAWLDRLQSEYTPAAVFGGDKTPALTVNPMPYDMLYSDLKTWVWVKK